MLRGQKKSCAAPLARQALHQHEARGRREPELVTRTHGETLAGDEAAPPFSPAGLSQVPFAESRSCAHHEPSSNQRRR